MNLTEHLLSLNNKFEVTIKHPFLEQVGELKIKPKNLEQWMFQSRYLMEGYIQMIGHMLSRISLYYDDRRHKEDSDFPYSEDRARRIFEALTQSLFYITRKSDLLTEFLSREPYKEHYRYLKYQYTQTTLHRRVLEKIARTSENDLGEGLMALWIMETVSLRAWEYARQINVEKALQETVHTKTCQDLKTLGSGELVDTLASLVNELDISDPQRITKIENVYKNVLLREIELWELAYHQNSY